MTFAVLEPVAADGKRMILPNIFPGDVILNFAGRADGGGVRYGGDRFILEKAGSGDATLTFSFQDGVFLTGGIVDWSSGSYGSYVTLEMRAPASTVEDPETPGTGNCNLVSTGYGFNMIVPADGDGAKQLLNPIPIPAENPETDEKIGYWEYSDPWLGVGTLSAGTAQHSRFNLFDTELKLCHFCDVSFVGDRGSRLLNIQNVKPKWVLPQWNFKTTLHNADSEKTLQMSWSLVLARKRSV